MGGIPASVYPLLVAASLLHDVTTKNASRQYQMSQGKKVAAELMYQAERSPLHQDMSSVGRDKPLLKTEGPGRDVLPHFVLCET